jgi:hypothetical protein
MHFHWHAANHEYKMPNLVKYKEVLFEIVYGRHYAKTVQGTYRQVYEAPGQQRLWSKQSSVWTSGCVKVHYCVSYDAATLVLPTEVMSR